MDDTGSQPVKFSAKDRLKLQQLQTIRALWEQSQLATAESDDGTRNETPHDSEPLAEINKWHLIAEDVKLHPWQQNCLEKWIAQGRGTVKVATGGGKTMFALAAAQELQNTKEPDLRLAIVVPSIPLMHQWQDELASANIPRGKIALMGGGESPPDDPDIRILICVLNSARDRLPDLVKNFGWSSRLMLVVDECHTTNATQASNIFDTNPKYSLGLSATPEPGDGDSTIPDDEAYKQSPVGKGLGPIIFEFSLKESLEAGLLTQFEVWHVGLPLNAEEGSQHAKLSLEITDLRKNLQAAHQRSRSKQPFIAWAQTKAKESKDAARFIGLANERKRLIYRAESRADLTLAILSAAKDEEERRTIVFHESIAEINKLYALAYDKKIPAVLEHSELPANLRAENINAFRKGDARTIISAKSLVVGFNVPSADIGIIAASSGSVRQRIQSLGRMLRKKASGGTATILVLYVRGTEDESIYEKADWESVVGTERNRYFTWDPDPSIDINIKTCSLSDLAKSFEETDSPPRQYRPPCSEIDGNDLEFGKEYPAQRTGMDLKVDQAGNLRPLAEDKSLVSASRKAVDKITEVNQYRRATLTPCGHLICRTAEKRDSEDTWIYLGDCSPPKVEDTENTEKLMIKSNSGRRVIAKKIKGGEAYALGPDKAKNAGLTRDMLLEWIREQEEYLSTTIRNLYWNNDTMYWIEVNGERIEYSGQSALEFPK